MFIAALTSLCHNLLHLVQETTLALWKVELEIMFIRSNKQWLQVFEVLYSPIAIIIRLPSFSCLFIVLKNLPTASHILPFSLALSLLNMPEAKTTRDIIFLLKVKSSGFYFALYIIKQRLD